MSSDTKFSIPAIPSIPKNPGWMGWMFSSSAVKEDVSADLAELKRKGYLQDR